MRILVTGGAGFVGSSLAIDLAKNLGADVRCVDNLKRRGSELNLCRLREAGVRFEHGDIRNVEDLQGFGPLDVIVECSAEAAAGAGYDGRASYVVNTNLGGTVNCLELARRTGAAFLFLSSSRVYPISALRELPLERSQTRFLVSSGASGLGWSEQGITTSFPLTGSRTLYGATKLCSELLIHEYAAMYGMRAVVNRCGVLAGPWQFGMAEQGFIAHWMACHLFGKPLSYIGFGGEGHQVRDILHVKDLYRLIELQLLSLDLYAGATYNIGGGPAGSVSLRELTALCEQHTGVRLEVGSVVESSAFDIPHYVTDNSEVRAATGWYPSATADQIVEDVAGWMTEYRDALESLFHTKAS